MCAINIISYRILFYSLCQKLTSIATVHHYTHSGNVFLGAIGTVGVKHFTKNASIKRDRAMYTRNKEIKLELKQAAAYVGHKVTIQMVHFNPFRSNTRQM